MKRTKFSFLAFILASVAVLASAQTPTGLADDSMVIAMREELQFNMEQLKTKPVPAYFMSLRMNDTYSAQVSSNFGVSITGEGRSRVITPQIRVGSPEIDNFKFENQTRSRNSYGDMSGVNVPYTDNAVMAVRQGIWSETMKRYDVAVSNYNNALSQMKTNADNEDKAPCFSAASVEEYYEAEYPASAYSFDRKMWEEKLDRVSAVFKECKYLEQGIASLTYSVERIYVVTSDGSAVVQNRKAARLMLNAVIRAADGMTCPLYKDWFSYSLDNFPDEETLVAEVHDLIERLLALREAPIADPYAGPALMAGGASGVFFHEIFGHRLEAHRMKSGGQTFKKLVDSMVLPASFNVYDDPTAVRYAGTDLYGSYKYDDEGVLAQRVHCVEDGVLKNFLVDRTPIDGFPASNGHGRASDGYDPVSRQSNLIIETSTPYTEEQLRQMLIDAVKADGKEYGYYFRTATSGLTYTGEGGSINSFGVDPVEVYRVFTDGRPDELVRGVTLIGTPLAMFSGIVAGGAAPTVFTGECGAESGWVPVTAISPTIFISKVETQRSETGYQLPQVLEKPDCMNVTGEDGDVIFRAMNDELQRTMNGLQVEGQALPHYADFRINSTRMLRMNATLGGLLDSHYVPQELTGSVGILIGDSMCVSDIQDIQIQMGHRAEYDCIRRSLWYLDDIVYKNAIRNYSQKNNLLLSNPKPENEASIPEIISLSGGEYIQPAIQNTAIDREKMEDLAKRLSAVYLDYPKLYNTNVYIGIEYTDVYRLNSENLKVRMPYMNMTLQTRASVRSAEGSELSEYYDIAFDCTDYDAAQLESELREFAEAMLLKGAAETVNDFYIGPILLEKQAVSYSFNSIVNEFGSAQTTWNMNSIRYNIQNTTLNGSVLLGKRFLDTRLGIHLYSDMESYNGIRLGGSYEVDFDGIRPEHDFVLVEKGMLKRLMSGRYPGVGSERPTGHSMLPAYSIKPEVRMSIMHVTFDGKTKPMSKMKAQLISEARKAGLDHTYMLRNIRYNCYLLTRIDVRTGKETVINANTPEFGRRELMHVISASKEEDIQSYPHPTSGYPTMIAPEGMLLESVEMNLTKPAKASEFQLTNPAWR